MNQGGGKSTLDEGFGFEEDRGRVIGHNYKGTNGRKEKGKRTQCSTVWITPSKKDRDALYIARTECSQSEDEIREGG